MTWNDPLPPLPPPPKPRKFVSPTQAALVGYGKTLPEGDFPGWDVVLVGEVQLLRDAVGYLAAAVRDVRKAVDRGNKLIDTPLPQSHPVADGCLRWLRGEAGPTPPFPETPEEKMLRLLLGPPRQPPPPPDPPPACHGDLAGHGTDYAELRELPLSPRACKVVYRAAVARNATTLAGLAGMTAAEWRGRKNCGELTTEELVAFFAKRVVGKPPPAPPVPADEVAGWAALAAGGVG